MAFYSPLPDGSFEVETDDGRTLRTALDPSAFGALPKEAKAEQAQQALGQFDSGNTVALGRGEVRRDSRGNPMPIERPDTIPSKVGNFEIAGGAGEEQKRPAVQANTPAQPVNYSTPKAPIKIVPPAPSSSQQSPQNSQLNQIQDLVASQIVQRSAPRKGAGEVPTGKTVTRGPTASPEDLDTIAEQELTTEAGVLNRAEQSFYDREAMLDQAIERNAAREQQLAEQAAKRQAVDAKLVELQTHAEQKEREVSEMQTLSPTDEYFKNSGGIWARLLAGLMTLAGGVGQAHLAAAGISSENQGLKAVQGAIKERAEMLRQEYEQAKEAGRTARNAYSDMLQMYGTPEMAMAALNDRGEAIADKKLVLLAEKMGNQDALNQAMQWQAQRSEARAMRVAQRNADAAGQVTQTFGYDRGGGGGAGLNYKALDAYMALEKAKGGAADEEGQAYSKALQAEGIPQAEAKLGAMRDILSKMPKSGEVPTIESRNVVSRATRAAADFVGGAGTGTRMLDNETERTVRGQFDRAKAELRHALAGASLTQTEKTDFEGRFDTVNTTEGLTALADELASSIERRKAAIGAGFRPGVTERYEQRKGGLAPRPAPAGTRADE